MKEGLTGESPSALDFEKALMFFHAYMYGPLQGKLRLYNARKVRGSATTPSSDWEVFASILVNDVGKKLGSGVDLSSYEVKSALSPGSYEYQYHKNTGRDKLRTDASVGHLFFEHSDNLRLVKLRYAHGSQMKQFFEKWLAEFPEPYGQRYRKNIPYGWVAENADLLMVLTDGEVTFPAPAKDSKEAPTAVS
ncbi:MAG: hypothetical protein ACJ8NS_13665 [Chthoniobacterales bacterium]